MNNLQYLNDVALRNACKNLLDTWGDITPENFPTVHDIPDSSLLALAATCMNIDDNFDFIVESKHANVLLTQLTNSCNSIDFDDQIDLIVLMHKALLDYYIEIIDDVFNDVAQEIYTEQLDIARETFSNG